MLTVREIIFETRSFREITRFPKNSFSRNLQKSMILQPYRKKNAKSAKFAEI